MAQRVIIHEEPYKYLCESDQSSLSLAIDKKEEFINEVTTDDLLDFCK